VFIDVRTEAGQVFKTYLEGRNAKTADKVQQQIEQNSFLLVNACDDIWFWPVELISNFQGTVLEQVFNFYQGPLPLESVERLVLSESGENDFHIVVFAENAATDEEARKKLKTFRKFHTMNTDKNFHFKFWICENKEVA
jgi:hypothetical protein